MHRWWLGAVVGIGSSVCASGLVFAQIPVEPSNAPKPLTPYARQENFGFGPELGFYNPNGLDVRAGARDLSLDVTAGFIPVLLSYGSSQNPDYKLLVPFEISPQLLFHVITFKDDIRGGLRLGYRYNSALGHGATLGGQIGKRMSRKLLLEGMWGISYYPRAGDRLRGNQVPAGTSFDFPPEISTGLSVGLLFFP